MNSQQQMGYSYQSRPSGQNRRCLMFCALCLICVGAGCLMGGISFTAASATFGMLMRVFMVMGVTGLVLGSLLVISGIIICIRIKRPPMMANQQAQMVLPPGCSGPVENYPMTVEAGVPPQAGYVPQAGNLPVPQAGYNSSPYPPGPYEGYQSPKVPPVDGAVDREERSHHFMEDESAPPSYASVTK